MKGKLHQMQDEFQGILGDVKKYRDLGHPHIAEQVQLAGAVLQGRFIQEALLLEDAVEVLQAEVQSLRDEVQSLRKRRLDVAEVLKAGQPLAGESTSGEEQPPTPGADTSEPQSVDEEKGRSCNKRAYLVITDVILPKRFPRGQVFNTRMLAAYLQKLYQDQHGVLIPVRSGTVSGWLTRYKEISGKTNEECGWIPPVKAGGTSRTHGTWKFPAVLLPDLQAWARVSCHARGLGLCGPA